MSASDDVPDSTDWLSTPLSGLAAVEAALRCEVCKDFYKTPMITSCSHTFCSLCIRRALSNDGKCPLCRATDQELKLRSNWSMEETVGAFAKAREAALSLARKRSSADRSPKRKAEDSVAHEAHAAPEPKRLRTSARLSNNRGGEATATILQAGEDIAQKSDDDDDYVPDAYDGLVSCPSCQNRMKDWQVFSHLEACPGPTANQANQASQATSETSATTFGLGQTQRRQQKTLERLPPLNYSMLKEQALRKKMAELGISSQGPRAVLEKRHKEWLTLWNANCDAAVPKKRSELFHDLDVWERTQGGRAPMTGRAVQNVVMIKDKDFDGAAWAAKHDTSFKELIASAMKSRMEAKKKPEEGVKLIGSESRSSTAMPPEPRELASPSLTQEKENWNADLPTQTRKPEADSQMSGVLETAQLAPGVVHGRLSDPRTFHSLDAQAILLWENAKRLEEAALYQQGQRVQGEAEPQRNWQSQQTGEPEFPSTG